MLAILRPMNQLLRNRHLAKTFMVLTALLVAASLFLAFFHFHEDGANHGDCPVCRLAQIVTGIFLLAAAALFIKAPERQSFLPVYENRFSSRLLTASLRDRAPPAFSF
jgi:hypothetical protein